MRFKLALTVCCLCLTAVRAFAGVDARMFHYPDVSETHIAFVYAGDIGVFEKGGGTASRRSSPLGEELFPRFSPHGRSIAYTTRDRGFRTWKRFRGGTAFPSALNRATQITVRTPSRAPFIAVASRSSVSPTPCTPPQGNSRTSSTLN
jgi:hypothetical protein